MAKSNAKAKSAKPEEFADARLVRGLDQIGFVKSLLVGKSLAMRQIGEPRAREFSTSARFGLGLRRAQ